MHKRVWILGLCLVVLGAGAGCDRFQVKMERALFDSINQRRRQAGLRPLVLRTDLVRLARNHTFDMVTRGILSHRGADGSLVQGRLDAQRVNWVHASENVARNKGFDDPVAEAVRGFMASRSHRTNILDPKVDETGVGVMQSPTSDYFYFTQVFVDRMPED